jgi:hypothetical protein
MVESRPYYPVITIVENYMYVSKRGMVVHQTVSFVSGLPFTWGFWGKP